MTVSSQFDRADLPAPSAVGQLSLPLVSVIVVNYNYGRFLAQAVASVFAQTYPQVECIVVDNASTDESPEVLAGLAARYPQLVALRRSTNGGQTVASLDGLATARGPYVVFLDADDFLLPRAVDLHILAHLSSRRHVGFTSGDMLQVQDGQVVVCGGSGFRDYVGSGRGARRMAVRAYRHPSGAWPDAALAALAAGRLHYVPSLHSRWVWAPTSGNCYRRDALDLFCDNPELAGLKANSDMYFAHGIGGLCGSILIDEPVFGYRLHGSNIFSRSPQLDWWLNYRAGRAANSNDQARALIVDQLVARAERFTPNLLFMLHWTALLIRLDVASGDPLQPRWARRSRAAFMLVSHRDALAAHLGATPMALLMFFFRVPLRIILRRGRK